MPGILVCLVARFVLQCTWESRLTARYHRYTISGNNNEYQDASL